MATIEITKDNKKRFSAYAAMDQIITTAKDMGSLSNHTMIKLSGYDSKESRAILSLLGLSIAFALHQSMSAPMEYKFNLDTGNSSIILPGVGSIVAQHNPDTQSTTISVPRQTLPAYEMERIMTMSKEALLAAKNSPITVGEERYYAMACNDKGAVDQQLFTIKPLAATHGYEAATDIFSVEELQTSDGPKPAILITKNALDDLLREEKIGAQRGR